MFSLSNSILIASVNVACRKLRPYSYLFSANTCSLTIGNMLQARDGGIRSFDLNTLKKSAFLPRVCGYRGLSFPSPKNRCRIFNLASSKRKHGGADVPVSYGMALAQDGKTPSGFHRGSNCGLCQSALAAPTYAFFRLSLGRIRYDRVLYFYESLCRKTILNYWRSFIRELHRLSAQCLQLRHEQHIFRACCLALVIALA